MLCCLLSLLRATKSLSIETNFSSFWFPHFAFHLNFQKTSYSTIHILWKRSAHWSSKTNRELTDDLIKFAAPDASAAPPAESASPLATETDTQGYGNEEEDPQQPRSPEPADTCREIPPGDAGVAEPEIGAEPMTPEAIAGGSLEVTGGVVSNVSPQIPSARSPENERVSEANVAAPEAGRMLFESLESIFR